MKKGLIVIVLVFVFLMAGCNPNTSKFPESGIEGYEERMSESRSTLKNSRIEDKKSFNKAVDLVAWTIDRNVEFNIVFFYEDTTTKEVSEFINITDKLQAMDDERYREILNADLTMSIFKKLDELGLSKNPGKIVGSVLSWKRYNFLGNDTYYTVIDFDGNGTWDYATKHDWRYPVITFASNQDLDLEEGPRRMLDSNNEIGIYSDSRYGIMPLEELNGQKTFRQLFKIIEKLF